MFSTTGYFFDGSKFVGRQMTPYKSVCPSAAFALNGSGNFHPIAVSFETSAFSSGITIWPSCALRTTDTVGRSTRENASTKYLPSGENDTA